MKSLYWWWDSVISKEICENIIQNTNWKQKHNGLFNTKKGFTHSDDVRKTEVVFDNRLSLAECILRAYALEANKLAQWNFLISEIQNIQIGRYVDGGHYAWHNDAPVLSKNTQRKLSTVLFLSDPSSYEGGHFEFKDIKLPFDKAPQGSIIVFPSFQDHRVTPVISGERYTAVGWLEGPAFK
jgi:PKHD-type hydroxylase